MDILFGHKRAVHAAAIHNAIIAHIAGSDTWTVGVPVAARNIRMYVARAVANRIVETLFSEDSTDPIQQLRGTIITTPNSAWHRYRAAHLIFGVVFDALHTGQLFDCKVVQRCRDSDDRECFVHFISTTPL